MAYVTHSGPSCAFGFRSVGSSMRPATLPVSPALPPNPFGPDPFGLDPLRLLSAQADLQYHAAPTRGIFNPPAATGMGFWSINPYVGCAFGCAYCYARDTHRFTLERAGDVGKQVANAMPPWLAFERRVLVKEHAGARVREALRSSRSPRPGDSVVIGSATDPYQPAERRFRVTRDILESLQSARGFSIVIITKSPLVTVMSRCCSGWPNGTPCKCMCRSLPSIANWLGVWSPGLPPLRHGCGRCAGWPTPGYR